jgi:hypothetical protein
MFEIRVRFKVIVELESAVSLAAEKPLRRGAKDEVVGREEFFSGASGNRP